MNFHRQISAFAGVVLATCALFAAPVGATGFQNHSGLASSTSVENFNSPAVANYTAAGSLFTGITFGNTLKVTTLFGGSFGLSGQAIVNFGSDFVVSTAPSLMSFSSVLSGIGIYVVTNPGPSIFSAYLNNVLVESFTAPTGNPTSTQLPGGGYYGFTGIKFNSLRIEAGGFNGALIMDNMQFAQAVPEPASYAMLLIGLGLLGFTARGRKIKTV